MKLILIIGIVSLLLIIGCDDDTISKEEFKDYNDENILTARELCNSKNMNYVSIEYKDYENYTTLCKIDSPMRIKRI